METTTLRGHFDGKQIQLDEPYDLQPNTELIITVLPNTAEAEREDWVRLSVENLALAYADDEPEYSTDSIRELNPSEGR